MKNFDWIAKEVYMVALLVCHCFNKGSCNIRWPDGNYALPMSVYGCPEPDMASWKYGYINISFTERTDLYEKTLGSIGWNHSFLMLLGPYGPYSYQLNFCMKDPASSTIASTDTPMWPPGKYSIIGTAAGCPEGFAAKNITVTIPEIEHINKDGALPAIDVRIEDGSSLMSFLFCEKEVSAMVEPIHGAISFPFVVHMVQDEPVLQTSDYFDVINEQLYFVSNNNQRHQHIHNWLNYSVILPKRYEHVLPKEDCYDNPFLYSGTASITVTGFECKPWTDFIVYEYEVILGAYLQGGHHWDLVVIEPKKRVLSFYNPMGETVFQQRQVLTNWKNFLDQTLNDRNDWKLDTPDHSKQIDSFNCGVYTLMGEQIQIRSSLIGSTLTSVIYAADDINRLHFQFAEYHLLGIPCIFEQSDVSRKRKEVAATLLLYEANVQDCCPCCGYSIDPDEEVMYCGMCEKKFHKKAYCVGQYVVDSESDAWMCRRCHFNVAEN